SALRHRHPPPFPTRRSSDLPCFTDDPDAALGYLNGNAGFLYTVEIDEGALVVAGEATVRRVAEELDLADGYSYIWELLEDEPEVDRKSTRLNSSHVKISYAV